MRAVIVYESLFGHTNKIAEAIASGIWAQRPGADVACVPVGIATGALAKDADLLIVGGPAHMQEVSPGMSRKPGTQGEENTTEIQGEPGLRDWFRILGEPARPTRAAAFDTRAGVTMAGAAEGIARRLRRHGYQVIAIQGYIIEEPRGPLRGGEIDRARTWGASLTHQLAA